MICPLCNQDKPEVLLNNGKPGKFCADCRPPARNLKAEEIVRNLQAATRCVKCDSLGNVDWYSKDGTAQKLVERAPKFTSYLIPVIAKKLQAMCPPCAPTQTKTHEEKKQEQRLMKLKLWSQLKHMKGFSK